MANRSASASATKAVLVMVVAGTKVPLKLGDLQIIQNGVLATSLRMEPATVSGFNVTIPSGGTTFPTYTITLPEEITREKRKQPKVRYYERRGVVLGATSASTRLVLESEIPGLHAGMLVIANGVPYETTVVEVVKNVIKLSAASTIADATEIKFIKNIFDIRFSFNNLFLFSKDISRSIPK